MTIQYAPEKELSDADKQVAVAVRRALWSHEPLRASGSVITIDVEDGRVTLTGRVRTLVLKLMAGTIASYVGGVRQVVNRLVSDTELVRSVADALASDQRTARCFIRVDARLGEVRLAGEVPSPELVEIAEHLARGVPGVAGVRSELAAKPASTSTALPVGAAPLS